MRLQKGQGNAIFEAVTAGGLDPSDCTLDDNDTGARIAHLPSGSYFLLEGGPGHYISTHVVGDGPKWGPLENFTWAPVPERVQRWAADVKRDADTPDLWAELQREQLIIAGARSEGVDNTPFTDHEQAEIAVKVREIKVFVHEAYSLDEHQMVSIDAKLDDIRLAAGRIGRKDWQLVVYGTMFSVIVAGLLPPEAVRRVLVMLLRDLIDVLTGGSVPLLLPPGT